MISAAIRVIARAAAIRVEEAAVTAGPSTWAKGKARATQPRPVTAASSSTLPLQSSFQTREGQSESDKSAKVGPSQPPASAPDHAELSSTLMQTATELRHSPPKENGNRGEEDDRRSREHTPATFLSDGRNIRSAETNSGYDTTISPPEHPYPTLASESANETAPPEPSTRSHLASELPLGDGVSPADPKAPGSSTVQGSSDPRIEIPTEDDDVIGDLVLVRLCYNDQFFRRQSFYEHRKSHHPA